MKINYTGYKVCFLTAKGSQSITPKQLSGSVEKTWDVQASLQMKNPAGQHGIQ